MKRPTICLQWRTLRTTPSYATYDSLFKHPNAKVQRRMVEIETTTFCNMVPHHIHYTYRHVVDDHNNHRYSDISLEETWVKSLDEPCFCFPTRSTGYQIILPLRCCIWHSEDKVPLLRFRRRLAKALIYNEYLDSDSLRRSKRMRDRDVVHELQAPPDHAQSFRKRDLQS